MGALDRRSLLIGAAAGIALGGGAGFFSGYQGGIEHARAVPAGPGAATSATPPGPEAPAEAGAGPRETARVRPSFAQQGEDLVMHQMLVSAGIRQATYLDIGAHDPVVSSNTYLFYVNGGRGVLVEPNPTYAKKLREVRDRDVVLEVGIGVTDRTEANYFLINGDGQLNTFSKEHADSLVTLHHRRIEGVLKRELVNVNRVLEQHFKDRAPDVVSIDVEGLDYEILKTLDFKRWRPRIICAETANVATGKVEREIVTLLEKNGYAVRGGSLINTIFLDDRAPPPTVTH